ncbi:Apc15p protein-domain-containing protein [Triangularia verruculosa]|uniref:Apc15p protein-domain-containing protein n=1 Tax=Triangularia verruculosa TaxID=2587418 RepID=A0AAN7ASL8_9PEZI|nr:Apc15p protein-domain-containing protein [Triangularia verruculosa]
MFSTLPDLTPRDCHSLWYTSPRHPPLPPSAHHPSSNYNDPTALDTLQQQPPPQPPPPFSSRHKHSSGNSIIDRSLLGRLKADELLILRRQAHIANLGQAWLKPPGLQKTLLQIREEDREAKEHAEALRRELAAQELAEAAERAQQEEQEQDEDLLPGEEEGMMVDLDNDIPEGSEMEMGEDQEDEEEEENLDDDIPEGDLDDDIPEGDLDDDIPEGDLDDDIPSGGGFGYDGASDDDEGDTEAEQNNTFQTAQFDTSGDESSSIDPNDLSLTEVQQQRRMERRELQARMATMRAQEQRMRELMVRGQPRDDDEDLYGGGGEDEHDLPRDGQHNMLEEEDLVSMNQGVESGDELDMDADLDDDIPDASGLSGVSAGFGLDGAGYEHTDSEAELSEDDNTNANISFARGSVRASARRQQQNFRSSGVGQQQQQQNFRSSGGNFRSSAMGRGGGGGQNVRFDPRSSLNHDISGFLSLDGSSMIGSSPHASFRRSRQG